MKKILFGIVFLLGLSFATSFSPAHAAETMQADGSIVVSEEAALKEHINALQARVQELQAQANTLQAQQQQPEIVLSDADRAALKTAFDTLGVALTQLQTLITTHGRTLPNAALISKSLENVSSYLVAVHATLGGGGTPRAIANIPAQPSDATARAQQAPEAAREAPATAATPQGEVAASGEKASEEQPRAASAIQTFNFSQLPWTTILVVAAILLLIVWFVKAGGDSKLGKLAQDSAPEQNPY